MSDEDADEEYFAFYNKHPYKQVLHVPGTDWKIEAIWDDAYYYAAKRLIEEVIDGTCRPAIEGVAALYLVRHYLEIALKFLIFHSRWLEDAHTNADDEKIQAVRKTHSLKFLWETARAECKRIVPPNEWKRVDVEFVETFIQEFDAIDPDGERFRYHGPVFGLERDPQRRAALACAQGNYLYIDFQELLQAINHTYQALNYLDTYMVETHGENEEWEDMLRSL